MIKFSDRIKEKTYTIGIGNFALSGVVQGFSSFSSAYYDNESFFYGVTDGSSYEIGSGVYVSASNQIKRFPIKSTNNNQLVNFPEGLKEVYVTYPATHAIFHTSGIYSTPQQSGIAFWTSHNSLAYDSKLIFDSGNTRLGFNKSNPSFTIDIGGNSPQSIVRASGFVAGNSGIYFPSGNGGLSSYSGGRQLFHFEKNQLDINASQLLQLSGIVNQNILLKKQNANMIFAGPSGACSPPCNPDYPTFRYLVKGDLPEEISNLTIGDQDSSTFLTINLPHGLPSNVYRDIGAISINTDSTAFLVNGLGQIKFGTIGYDQVDGLDSTMNSVSGILNDKIDTIQNQFGSSIVDKSRCEGRLSINSSNAISEGYSDSLYFVPYNGNTISLYNGTSWQTISFESTLVKTAYTIIGIGGDANGRVFDIFAYLSGGNIAFESQIWTNNTTRSVALSKRDGIYVKSSDNTRRYIGSVMPINIGGYPPLGGNKFFNQSNYRYIYNYYNRTPVLAKYRTSRTWTCNSNVWRQLLNTYIGPLSSITINVLCGIQDDTISATVSAKCYSALISNSNYMLTINSSNFDINSIESPYYMAPTTTHHVIDSISADYNDNIEKQLYGSMTQVVPVGVNTYYVAERVLSGKNTPNLTFDYTNGIYAIWRC